jgi:hypothetical protein
VSTTKVSVTIDESALAWLRRRAKRVHGGNLSAAIAEAALVARRQEALEAFLREEGVPELSERELNEIVAEWAPPQRKPRRSKKAVSKRR